jgi:hypothetical protein
MRAHNGNGIAPHRREMVMAMLRQGESLSAISRQVGCARDVVRALRDSHCAELRQAKEVLAAKCDIIAMKATDQLSDQLDSKHKLTPQQLVPVIGVMVEKSIMLRSDPTIHVIHDHQHRHLHAHISPATFDQLLSHLPDDPTEQVQSIEVTSGQQEKPLLPAPTSAPSGGTVERDRE